MSRTHREKLRPIIEREAISYAVAKVPPKEIDRINILNASFLAMHKSVKKLTTKPALLLIDGNRFNPLKGYKHECIIKGDGKYLAIAAASVLAKTYRDEYMQKIHKKHPCYGWVTNMGYATKAHRYAVRDHGRSPHHRKSFTVKELDMPELFTQFPI